MQRECANPVPYNGVLYAILAMALFYVHSVTTLMGFSIHQRIYVNNAPSLAVWFVNH
jgi:hypothetical protein